MTMDNKKGQIGNLQGIILTILIVGILLGTGFLVFNELKNQTDDYTITITDETLTSVTETGKYVDYNYTTSSIDCFNGVTFSAVENATGGETIAAGNYTTTTNGLIQSIGGSYNNTNWNVTYSYAHGREGCSAIETTTDAIGVIPSWLTIIIIITIVGILLVIVFRVLPIAGKGAGGTIAEV